MALFSIFNHMSIGKKLVGGFLAASLITGLVGGIGFFRISSTMGGLENLVAEDVAFLKQVQELSVLALQHRRYEKDFFLNIGNPEKQQGYIKKFEGVSGKTEILLNTVAGAAQADPHLTQEVKSAVNSAHASYGNYVSSFSDLTREVMADPEITPQEANKLMTPFKDHIYAFENGVDIVSTAGLEMVDKASEAMIFAGKRSRIFIGVLLAAGVAVSLILGALLAAMISGPVRTLVSQAERLAGGDFSQDIPMDRGDEIGQLTAAMNTMVHSLRSVLQDVVSSSGSLAASSGKLKSVAGTIAASSEKTAASSGAVASAAEEMSMNMNGVAAASEEAEASIAMIVSAAEEMSASIVEISENTAKGSQITRGAVEDAAEVSRRMDALGNAAQAISKVTEAIEEISEQTNLLALNATIEAARAGEAGKGFAVVAGEIKALAQQTAQATQEISQNIAGMQETTRESVDAIGGITRVINEINEIVVNMSSAIEEQAATTREISDNVTQAASGFQEINENISQSTTVAGTVTEDIAGVSLAAEETRGNCREISDNAGELAELSLRLDSVVAMFKV